MPKRYLLLLFAAVLLATTGCARNAIINVDGMPISNHEYNLTNEETGIRAVFVLTRYYREYEGKEYIVKPEFLDALKYQRIDPEKFDDLILHLKVVNLKRKYFSVSWEVSGPGEADQALGHMYSGKLSRKDFYVKLPLSKPGEVSYTLNIRDFDGDDLYSLPLMRYKVKGGVETNRQEP